MKKTCPQCQSKVGLRRIKYGLLNGPVDESKFVLGGCCISENDPSIRCIECNWEGEFKNNIPNQSGLIQVAQLKPIVNMTDIEIDEYAKELWGKLTNNGGGLENDNSKS